MKKNSKSCTMIVRFNILMLAVTIAKPRETANKDPPPTTPICYTADDIKFQNLAATEALIYINPKYILLSKEKKTQSKYALLKYK